MRDALLGGTVEKIPEAAAQRRQPQKHTEHNRHNHPASAPTGLFSRLFRNVDGFDRRHAGRQIRQVSRQRGGTVLPFDDDLATLRLHVDGTDRREITLHVPDERTIGRITGSGIDLQHTVDQRIDLRADPIPDLTQRLGRTVETRADHRRRVLAVKRRNPRDRMVERSAQTEDVGTVIDLLAADLLRRDIIRGTPNLIVRTGRHRRQTEIDQLRIVLTVKEDIFGFDVAVDQSRIRTHRQPLSDLQADVDDHRGIQRPLLHHLVETAAIHQLHRDVRLPLLLTE